MWLVLFWFMGMVTVPFTRVEGSTGKVKVPFESVVAVLLPAFCDDKMTCRDAVKNDDSGQL